LQPPRLEYEMITKRNVIATAIVVLMALSVTISEAGKLANANRQTPIKEKSK